MRVTMVFETGTTMHFDNVLSLRAIKEDSTGNRVITMKIQDYNSQDLTTLLDKIAKVYIDNVAHNNLLRLIEPIEYYIPEANIFSM